MPNYLLDPLAADHDANGREYERARALLVRCVLYPDLQRMEEPDGRMRTRL